MTKKTTVYLDDLWKQDRKALLHEPNRKITLVFPEGSETTCYLREVVLSLYIWSFFKDYDCVLLNESFMVRAPINQKSIGKTFEKILDVYIDKLEEEGVTYEQLARFYSQMNNELFNDISGELTEYTTSATGPDLVDIIHHPKMESIFQNTQPNHRSMKEGYKEATHLLNNDPYFRYNPFVRALKVGSINKDQFLHVVLYRGAVTDIDYWQFPDPVLSGYGRGIYNVLWSAQESRDACIANLHETTPVQKSDYLNRRLQMLTGSIRKIFKGDCGTKETLPWYVGENDLDSLIGVNYIAEDGNIKDIKATDKNLIGKIIQIRAAPLCHKLHLNGVCETCFGRVAKQIPENYAVGHISVIGALGAFVQLSLSAKHLIVSREAVTFVLSSEASKVLDFPRKSDENTLVVLPQILDNGNDVEFIFKTKDLRFLEDIANGLQADEIQISTASFIEEVMTEVKQKNQENATRIVYRVSDVGRKSFISKEFLEYIINNQDLLVINRNLAHINLERWNPKLPMFNIPVKITGVADFMRKFESTILRGTTKYDLNAQSPVAISDMMRMCYNIVRECVNISVSHLGIMISSLLIRDKQALDYRFPLPNGKRQFDSVGNLYANRSLAKAMAYEKRIGYFRSPASTLISVRMNHPFDTLYFPEQADVYADVIRAYEKGYYSKDVLPNWQKGKLVEVV